MKTHSASVQVMLFKDRLEVWNPGTLPPTLTLEKLRGPHASVPHNPLIAEPMYLTKYIERMGTGIIDMIRRCSKAGLPEPEIRLDGGFFVLTIRRKKSETRAQSRLGRDQVTPQITPQDTPQVRTLLSAIVDAPLSRGELQDAVGIKDREHFRKAYLEPLLTVDWIERTIPDKPTSRLQKYRLTEKGRRLVEQLEKGKGRS